MIIGRLFCSRACSSSAWSWSRPRTVEARRAYKDGLNRALFLPFIAHARRALWTWCGSPRARISGWKLAGQPVARAAERRRGRALDAAMDDTWRRLPAGQTLPSRCSPSQARQRARCRCAHHAGSRAGRSTISAAAAGRRPTISRSRTNSTPVLIDRIPVMGEATAPTRTKRFIILIDTLYRQRREARRLGGPAEPDALCRSATATRSRKFRRTASRLPLSRCARTFLARRWPARTQASPAGTASWRRESLWPARGRLMTVGPFARPAAEERPRNSCGELIIGVKPSRAASPSQPAISGLSLFRR